VERLWKKSCDSVDDPRWRGWRRQQPVQKPLGFGGRPPQQLCQARIDIASQRQVYALTRLGLDAHVQLVIFDVVR
jgi:hypothetical protein